MLLVYQSLFHQPNIFYFRLAFVTNMKVFTQPSTPFIFFAFLASKALRRFQSNPKKNNWIFDCVYNISAYSKIVVAQK